MIRVFNLSGSWHVSVDQEKQEVYATYWTLYCQSFPAWPGAAKTATMRHPICGDTKLAILAATDVGADETVITLARDYLIANGESL